MITDFVRSSFSYSAPAIWNDLPAEILFSDSESGFQWSLKTFHHCNINVVTDFGYNIQ